MILNGFFITGTDTNIGKTQVAVLILKALRKKSYKTIYLKPVSSGCEYTPDGFCNPDAYLLRKYSTIKMPYDLANPFSFNEPIAPNIAAKLEGKQLTVKKILRSSERILNTSADCILIEGAGGFLVPINDKETMGDLAHGFGFPVILVVGLRLGCLNHAILTHQAICNLNLKIAGWVAFLIDKKMQYVEENIATLQQHLKVKFLGLYPNLDLKNFESRL